MSVKSPYLAAEHSAMDRRSRGLHRFLVSSPILLLLAVGLVGHLKKAHHVGAAGTAEYDQNVLAYQKRVARAEDILGPFDPGTISQVMEEAGNWAKGYADGTLKTLEPAAFEDHLNDSPRGEALRAGLGLSAELGVNAEEEVAKGQVADAAEKALVSGEAAFGLRNFELQAHIQCTMALRRTLNILTRAWPQLPAATRAAYQVRLRPLIVPEGEPAKMAALEKQQLKDYIKRQGRENIPPEIDIDKEDSTTDRQQMAAERSIADLNGKIAKLLQS